MLNYYAIFPKSLLLNIIYCKQYLCTTVVIIWGFSNLNFFNPFKWQNLAIKLSAKLISDAYSLAYCESKDVYTFGININPMFMYRWEAVSVHNESLVRCNLHFEHFYWVTPAFCRRKPASAVPSDTVICECDTWILNMETFDSPGVLLTKQNYINSMWKDFY